MKVILLGFFLFCSINFSFAQTRLISYDDLKYLLHNNLQKADTFLVAKGYQLKTKNEKTRNREYRLSTEGGTYIDIHLRADGKRLFIELETDEVSQYDLINSSISQYLNKAGSSGDVQAYFVKDLCNIYITINDTVPYSPLKKDYDMQIVADKNVTAYN